jgi:DsbC/DsbD-like thiol-disulfide interchange protein
MIRTLLRTFAIIAFLVIPPVTGWTASDPVSLDDVASVDVLHGWRTNSGTHMAAILIRLAPGWKTYWRAPGDAGIPPSFNWQGSRNLSGVVIHWPRPTVFYLDGTRSIGYADEVIIPVELTRTSDATDTISLRGKMELGVCDDVCMPLNVRLRADLSSGATADTAISASLADVPMTAASGGVTSVTCQVEPISDGIRLSAHITMPSVGNDEIAIVESADQAIWISQAIMARKGGILTATVEMVPPNATPFMLQRSDIRITVLGSERAVDIQGCVSG